MQSDGSQKKKIENNVIKCQKVDKATNVEEDQPYFSNRFVSNNRYINNNKSQNFISLKISVYDLQSFFGKTLVNTQNNNLLKNSFKIEKMKNLFKRGNINTRTKSNNAKNKNCNSIKICNNIKLREKLKQNKYITIKTTDKFLLKNLNEPNCDNINISTSKNITKNFVKEEYNSNNDEIRPTIKSEKKFYNFQKKFKDNKYLINNEKSKTSRNLSFKMKHYKIHTCYIEPKLPTLKTSSYDELENNLSSTISSFNLNNILPIKKYKLQKKSKLNLKLKENNFKKFKSSTKEKLGSNFLTKFLNELYEKRKKQNIIAKNAMMK